MNIRNFGLPRLIANTVLSRAAWLQKLLDPQRDVEKECGHPELVSMDDFRRLFKRGDIAKRVVTLFPDETWSEDPWVYETEEQEETPFEKAWEEIKKSQAVYPMLHRADILSGIGRYGVLVIGVDDGAPLDQPIPGIGEDGRAVESAGRSTTPSRKLIYLRPMQEQMVKISRFQQDPRNPRFGMPIEYDVTFVDSSEFVLTPSDPKVTGTATKVHWSRVIHLADNRTDNEIFGAPRMEVVYNRLLDLKKVAGGSGEMFWKGGFPGLSLETQPHTGEEIVIDKEATREQMELYMSGLQRYLLSENVTAKSLLVQVADPTSHVDTQLKLIGIAMGVPWRILAGSEAAQLASEQDARAWTKRIYRRRTEYVDPFVLRPFVDRLILADILPNPAKGYLVQWPDINSLNSIQQAEIANTKSNALSKYALSGADTVVPPFQYLTSILGYTEKEATEILAQAETHTEETQEDEIEFEKKRNKALGLDKQTGPNGKPGAKPAPARK